MNTKEFEELTARRPEALKVKVKAKSGHPGYPATGLDCVLEVEDSNGNSLNIEAKDFTITGRAGHHPILATITVNVSELEVDADVIAGFDSSNQI